jgi:hypothetical protein
VLGCDYRPYHFDGSIKLRVESFIDGEDITPLGRFSHSDPSLFR